LGVQAPVSAAVGVATGLVFLALDVEHAALWGVRGPSCSTSSPASVRSPSRAGPRRDRVDVRKPIGELLGA